MYSKKMIALAFAGALASGIDFAQPMRQSMSIRSGERWPHPTKKRFKRADRIRAYKLQRSADRERRRRLEA